MAKTIFASAARTATANSSDIGAPIDYSGGTFILNITAASGTPTLDIKIQAQDEISGTTYIDVPGAAFAQKSGTGISMLNIHPAITASANVAVAQVVPRTFRVVATIGGGTPSLTFTLTYDPLR